MSGKTAGTQKKKVGASKKEKKSDLFQENYKSSRNLL